MKEDLNKFLYERQTKFENERTSMFTGFMNVRPDVSLPISLASIALPELGTAQTQLVFYRAGTAKQSSSVNMQQLSYGWRGYI